MIVDLSNMKFFCTRDRQRIVYHKEASCTEANGLHSVIVYAGRCPSCGRRYEGKLARSMADWARFKYREFVDSEAKPSLGVL